VIHASGEKPRSLGRVVAALLCRALLEDTILEPNEKLSDGGVVEL
jgi:hypothetical protein